MRRAKVVGNIWASKMEPSLNGFRIAILCEKSDNGAEDYFLAVDTVDAGIGDEVLTVSGSASRQSSATKKSPSDTTIVAIIDPNDENNKWQNSNTKHK